MMRRFAATLLLLSAAACTKGEGGATAKQITSRTELIGGPGALGEVGDYLLENERIRVIVQGPGYSRGFGLYGGSLIDADLVRPRGEGSSAGGQGMDAFSELFPAIFLKAMRPFDQDGIVASQAEDGSGAALVTVAGRGAEFVFIAQKINDLLIDSGKLLFQNEYRLAPGKSYVEITTTVVNQGDSPVELPGSGITSLSEQLKGLILPVGDVILFGAGNKVFAEKAGFDLRYTLEALYKEAPSLPQLPGLVTPFLATKSEGVSYGFMSGVVRDDDSFIRRAGYPDAAAQDLLVPFIASAFTGAYYGATPAVLEPRKAFSFKKYFIVGSGDVASIRDVVLEIRGALTGQFSGIVRDIRTQAPVAGAEIVTFDAEGQAYNHHKSDANGAFRGRYEPGRYSYRVLSDGRYTTEPVSFEVAGGAATYADVLLPPEGMVAVRVRDPDGRLLPSKCTLVGQYPYAAAGFDPKSFLYDLKIGEELRPTDLIADTIDPATREFVEHVLVAPSGQATEPVRPGSYRAVCSRGMEYTIAEQPVEVRAGELTRLDVTLVPAIDTAGWASGDYHLHSINSVDSFMRVADRVGHAAAEGLDVACSTDHNYVTDYAPYIAELGLETWLQGMVGLEMTTLEIGHFNGYPLAFDPGPITKGSFEWAGRPPQAIIDDLRGLGRHGPEATVIQVNHPRDTILGYFNDYNFNPDTGEPEEDTALLAPMGPEFGKDKFTYDFDALELYNGKRFELLHSYRVPDVLPPPPLPANIPPAGTVLRDADGKVAFPGGLEDWYALLKAGRVYTAMANSDTHSFEDEPGIPRTYLPVSDDRPGAISELELVQAIKSQNAMLTNGPFLRLAVASAAACKTRQGLDLGRTSCGMGEVASAQAGSVRLELGIDTAPWVHVDKVEIVWNGEVVRTLRGDSTTLARVTEQVPVNEDGFLLVEVSGQRSMWPVVVPLEVPSIQVSDALSSIAGAFGINFNPFGNLSPNRVSITYPYAFTNPVFVDGDGDGAYRAIGMAQARLQAESAPRLPVRRPDARGLPAVVKIFAAFGNHAH